MAQEPTAAPAPVIRDASRDAIPHAQLPETVIPSSYVIDMVIDPKADTMSGEVTIEAEIEADADGFWMHAKDMTIDSASMTSGPGVLSIEPDVIDLAEAPSGLVWMQLPEPHPGGATTITIRPTSGNAVKTARVRRQSGTPAKTAYAFRTGPPNRVPRPAAGSTTATVGPGIVGTGGVRGAASGGAIVAGGGAGCPRPGAGWEDRTAGAARPPRGLRRDPPTGRVKQGDKAGVGKCG